MSSEIRDRLTMDADVIRRRLKTLRVAPVNLQMVDYWLSLSRDGGLPAREDFEPAGASEFLFGCGLFDVRPGTSVTCRIAGMAIKLTFGPDVAGKDWLSITPARHRAQRLVRYSAVAQGAMGVGRRLAVADGREPVRIEEVMLPFRCNADGSCPVLVHTDWRPTGDEWFGIDSSYALTLADEFHLVELG